MRSYKPHNIKYGHGDKSHHRSTDILTKTSEKRAVIVTDSMSTLQKVLNCFVYADWMPIISQGTLEKIVWVFTPGHAGVTGNERADSLADAAVVDNNLTLDAPTVIQIVTEQLIKN